MVAESDAWLWLTGEPIAVRHLVGAEFGVFFQKVASEEGAELEHGHEGYGFIHDTAIIIVDEQGRVRAEYHDFPGAQQAMQDITMLVLEKNAQGIQRLVWQIAHWLKDAQ
jgi:cytochrome oxidase Cu insertion factor (SCO1/SenC/PrrC family)